MTSYFTTYPLFSTFSSLAFLSIDCFLLLVFSYLLTNYDGFLILNNLCTSFAHLLMLLLLLLYVSVSTGKGAFLTMLLIVVVLLLLLLIYYFFSSSFLLRRSRFSSRSRFFTSSSFYFMISAPYFLRSSSSFLCWMRSRSFSALSINSSRSSSKSSFSTRHYGKLSYGASFQISLILS